jgi:hypothetical protein
LPIRSAKICATWQAFSEPIDFARYAVTLMLAERRRQPFPATFATTAAAAVSLSPMEVAILNPGASIGAARH